MKIAQLIPKLNTRYITGFLLLLLLIPKTTLELSPIDIELTDDYLITKILQHNPTWSYKEAENYLFSPTYPH